MGAVLFGYRLGVTPAARVGESASGGSRIAYEAMRALRPDQAFVCLVPSAFGLWPFHLHGLIRSTIRTADDCTDDRWSPRDWAHTAQRALVALGEQRNTSPPGTGSCSSAPAPGPACLARDHLLELGWLADAAWSCVSDSIWEPIAHPPHTTRPTPWSKRSAHSAADSLSTASAASSYVRPAVMCRPVAAPGSPRRPE